MAEMLIEKGADVNRPDDNGRTVLHVTSDWSNLLEARLLIEHGADVNAADDDGTLPFHVVCGKGHLEFAKMLVDEEALMSGHQWKYQ